MAKEELWQFAVLASSLRREIETRAETADLSKEIQVDLMSM